jgi:hypothetical protein
VAVLVPAGPAVPHGRARADVAGGDLDAVHVDSCVEPGRNEGTGSVCECTLLSMVKEVVRKYP